MCETGRTSFVTLVKFERKVAAVTATATSTSTFTLALSATLTAVHLTHAAGVVVGSVNETSARKLVAFFVEAARAERDQPAFAKRKKYFAKRDLHANCQNKKCSKEPTQ